MQTRTQRKNKAIRTLQAWWRLRDPIGFRIIRRRFWIHRGKTATAYDADTLLQYIRRTRDDRDVLCRIPYSVPELCGLALVTEDLQLRTFLRSPPSPRTEIAQDHQLRAALENVVFEAAEQVARVDGLQTSFHELVGAVSDLIAVSNREHVSQHIAQVSSVMQRRAAETPERALQYMATVNALAALRTQVAIPFQRMPQSVRIWGGPLPLRGAVIQE